MIDGRPELQAEVADSGQALRSFIGRTFAQWAENPDFFIALTGHLPPDFESQKRFSVLERRIKTLATIS